MTEVSSSYPTRINIAHPLIAIPRIYRVVKCKHSSSSGVNSLPNDPPSRLMWSYLARPAGRRGSDEAGNFSFIPEESFVRETWATCYAEMGIST